MTPARRKPIGWPNAWRKTSARAALRAGEPYLTTTQAGRQLGISKSMAYRAMKILTDRQVLVSHPGRGTFVGPKAAGAPFEQTNAATSS